MLAVSDLNKLLDMREPLDPEFRPYLINDATYPVLSAPLVPVPGATLERYALCNYIFREKKAFVQR